MADFDSHQNGQPGPFEQFLQQSSVYREFVEASGPADCEIVNAQAEDHSAAEEYDDKLCVDLLGWRDVRERVGTLLSIGGLYYVQTQHALPRIPLLESGPAQPDLMYGSVPACGGSREFIQTSYLQARQISADLVGALLSRHRDYTAGDLPADAERLARHIRSACKAHAPRSLL